MSRGLAPITSSPGEIRVVDPIPLGGVPWGNSGAQQGLSSPPPRPRGSPASVYPSMPQRARRYLTCRSGIGNCWHPPPQTRGPRPPPPAPALPRCPGPRARQQSSWPPCPGGCIGSWRCPEKREESDAGAGTRRHRSAVSPEPPVVPYRGHVGVDVL